MKQIPFRHLIEGASKEIGRLYEIEDYFPLDRELMKLAEKAYNEGRRVQLVKDAEELENDRFDSFVEHDLAND